MTSEKRKSPRYAFFASVEITEQQTGVHLIGRTSELSLHGCYFDMMNPLLPGSIVTIQIRNHDETFDAKGHVIYSQTNRGMGVAFDEVGVSDQLILKKWLGKLLEG